jgi:hypothetical protein
MSDLSRKRRVVIGGLCGIAAGVCFAGAVHFYRHPVQGHIGGAMLVTGLLSATMAGSVLLQLRK